jgi:hypothetical protein
MLTFSINSDVHTTLLNVKLSKPTNSYGREWLSEAVFKAIDGKTDDYVDTNKYGYTIDMNTKMAQNKKQVELLNFEDLEAGWSGVSDKVASYVDLNVDKVIEGSEVATLVDTFLDVQDQLEIEAGVDLWKVFKLALSGNMRMIDRLRGLIHSYDLSSIFEAVLSNEFCMPALEVAMTC